MNRILPNPRVLVVDDDRTIHQAFADILTPRNLDSTSLDATMAALFDEPAPTTATGVVQFDLDSAMQGQQGYDKVKAAVAQGRPYDMAFVDMRMPPGWDGLETIEHLWQVDPNLEVVICTAFSDFSWDEIVRRLGHTHRLLLLRKPFDKAEVWQLASAQARKRHAEDDSRRHLLELQESNRRLAEEIKARTQVEDQLKHDALHDGLTDLPNRLLLCERLSRCMERAKRFPEYQYAVLFLDLDDFKLINDTLGHTVGDHLLMEIARRIDTSLRTLDTVTRLEQQTPARLGGDEFVVLLDGMGHIEDAAIVAERIRKAVGEKVTIADHEIFITTSVGIAHGRPEYQMPDDILRDADAALYHSKATGKGRVGLFDEKIHQQVIGRLKMSNDLRKAIDLRQLRLFYQAIVHLDDSRIEGFEALARWEHPELGFISPADFIPIAEETGLIHDLGRWVMREACQQLAIWQKTYAEYEALTISVNVSSKQLADRHFVEFVRKTLEDTGLEGRYLHIEVTESVLIEHTESVVRTFDALRKFGIGIHLDDFGTGYSSLSYLHKLPFDAIKIDRSFVNNIDGDGHNANIIQAIQSMASHRKMNVIAEGIETVDQMSKLQTMACDSGQGFYLSRPVDPRAVEGILSGTRPMASVIKAAA